MKRNNKGQSRNKQEIEKQQRKPMKPKLGFFKKTDKIDKHLVRWTTGKRQKTQLLKSEMKQKQHHRNTRVMRDYYKKKNCMPAN